MDATSRIMELHNQEVSYADIAAQLTREGYKTSRGREFTPNSVKQRIEAVLKKQSDASKVSESMSLSDVAEDSENGADLPLNSDPSETPDRHQTEPAPKQTEPLPEHWKQDIVDLIKVELERMQISQMFQKAETKELSPLPEADSKVKGDKGRKVNPWERVKIGVTVDRALSDLLEAKRKELGDVSLSRALDTVLWQYFGKPPLSFQQKETGDDPIAKPPGQYESHLGDTVKLTQEEMEEAKKR